MTCVSLVILGSEGGEEEVVYVCVCVGGRGGVVDSIEAASN